MRVVGMGALNVDRLYVVRRFAQPGEEVGVLRSEQSAGGSAANTVAGLARMGIDSGFIGAVGRDADGEFLLEELHREGVDTGCVQRLDAPTGVVIALVEESTGERCLYVHPGANDVLELDERCISYAEGAELLHISSFVGDRQFEAQVELSRRMKGRVSFAPGMLYARERCLVELRDILAASRVVFVNEEELFHMTGNRGERGAEMLLELGAGTVAVTKGADGCLVVDAEHG
ncbi:MAG: carbohydrate kinase family protein, partial [Euryarchaeota archaeon]|nr:carbohydrate kinase family protein [Euryarchaeota archaeon]